MEEIWKDVIGYEGLYQISNYGNIKSLKKWIRQYNKYINKEKLLKPCVNKIGYYVVVLYKNKNKRSHLLHRLIAEAFIPNPENKPQINHIDGNKMNYNISNLEWCTQSENMIHAFKNGLEKPNKPMLNRKGNKNPLSKKVIQFDLNNNFINEYNSYTEATNITKINHIGDCCNGKLKTAGGFIWKYK